MQLTVRLGGSGDEELSGTHVIRTFDDLDKLALRVGRAVKRWARSVPLRKQGSRAQITLDAVWVERGGGKAEPE